MKTKSRKPKVSAARPSRRHSGDSGIEIPFEPCLVLTGFRHGDAELVICSKSNHSTSSYIRDRDRREPDGDGEQAAKCPSCGTEHWIIPIDQAYREQMLQPADDMYVTLYADLLVALELTRAREAVRWRRTPGLRMAQRKAS